MPFLGVLRGAQPLLLGQFVIRRRGNGFGEALADGRAHGDDRKRGVLRDFAGQGQCRFADIVEIDEPIGEPEFQGLFARNPSPRQEHHVRCLLTDQPRQRDREPEARVDAELGEVGGEPRLRRRDAKVGGQRQAQTATDGRPLHGSHDRLLRTE